MLIIFDSFVTEKIDNDMNVLETKQALRALYEGRIWDGFDKVHYSKFLVDLDGA